jgi:hypothetical protein
MSTAMNRTRQDVLPHGTARATPLLVAGLAIPTFVAFWIGGNPRAGLIWGGLSVLAGLVLALGGRSDTIRLMRGEDADERWLAIETQATMITGHVVTGALAVLFLVTAARGDNPLVYGVLLLLAEATHLVALAVLNRKG